MAEAEKSAAAPAESAPTFKTFTLRKPISAHGDTISEIKLREPTAADITRCGYPVIMQGGGVGGTIQVVTDADKMTMMIAALALMPPSSVNQLNPRDWSTIAFWLAGFFVPDWDQLQKD